MIKVLIKKQDQITNQAQFSSNEEAEQWLARHQEMKSFGEVEEYEIIIEDISAKIEQDKINSEAQDFLDSTDYKVSRHLRQKALGQEPSLSDSEYWTLNRSV